MLHACMLARDKSDSGRDRITGSSFGCFLFVFVVVQLTSNSVFCLDFAFPSVRNFTKDAYLAASQNWSVTKDLKGIVYVANNSGLLEYDGATWTLYPLPDGGVIRAVAADSTGRIYTSGYRELGYWTRNDLGQLEYTSLKEMAEPCFTPNVEYWDILFFQGKVIFQAFTQMLIYENGHMIKHEFSSFTNTSCIVNSRLLISIMNYGIYEMDGLEEKPFLTGDFFKGKLVRFILPFGDDTYLIGTESHGIFLHSGGSMTAWETPMNDYFRKNQINRGCLLPSGELLVGTILDGISLLDRSGKLIWKKNSGNGLQNNTILGMKCDANSNIWLALDRGIDLIPYGSGTGISFYPVGGIGAVYTAALFEDKLYLGTNQGLYQGDPFAGGENFTLLNGTQGQVWNIKTLGNNMVVGHNSGTLLVRDGNSRVISNVAGGFSLVADPADPDVYWQSTYSNLVRFDRMRTLPRQSKVIFNFNELIRYIEFDHLGNLWAGHMHRGIFRLRLNEARDSVRIMHYYGQESIFGKENNLHVFKVENRVVFTTGDSLYTYDDLNDTIIPYTQLNRRIREFAKANRIIKAGENLYWFITPQKLGLLRISGSDGAVIREFPKEIFRNQLISDYENIISLDDGNALVTMENGYGIMEVNHEKSAESLTYNTPFPVSVVVYDQKGTAYAKPVNLKILKIPFSKNSIHYRFAFPHSTSDKITFQSQMQGLSKAWSAKSESPTIAFERLPAGKYTLNVLVTDSWGNESQKYSASVIVLSPWYWSVIARVIYMLSVLGLLLVFRSVIIRNTRKKEDRKREEKEKELITLKNEKLQNEISYKARELANSTMVIIKKNEILLELKEILIRQKNQLGNRFPEKYHSDLMQKIEENLSSHEEWKVFDTNFEQAHEAFIRNLKNRYPDLTPNDMRLCAFLRMNYSSKEIAPMLGISIRGVENHRYRLRQKMKLEHDENLTEIILNL